MDIDIQAFRKRFTAFSDELFFPDERIIFAWEDVPIYIAGCGKMLSGAALDRAKLLMTAHLLQSNSMVAEGKNIAGAVSSASVSTASGSASVSLSTLQTKTAFQAWLASTPYGIELYALINVKSAGGFYVGGSPEIAAFRRAGGRFR